MQLVSKLTLKFTLKSPWYIIIWDTACLQKIQAACLNKWNSPWSTKLPAWVGSSKHGFAWMALHPSLGLSWSHCWGCALRAACREAGEGKQSLAQAPPCSSSTCRQQSGALWGWGLLKEPGAPGWNGAAWGCFCWLLQSLPCPPGPARLRAALWESHGSTAPPDLLLSKAWSIAPLLSFPSHQYYLPQD